jgi:hypothetical protein
VLGRPRERRGSDCTINVTELSHTSVTLPWLSYPNPNPNPNPNPLTYRLTGLTSASSTLAGQAYGAGNYHEVGLVLQRSIGIITLCTLPHTATLRCPLVLDEGSPADG